VEENNEVFAFQKLLKYGSTLNIFSMQLARSDFGFIVSAISAIKVPYTARI